MTRVRMTQLTRMTWTMMRLNNIMSLSFMVLLLTRWKTEVSNPGSRRKGCATWTKQNVWSANSIILRDLAFEFKRRNRQKNKTTIKLNACTPIIKELGSIVKELLGKKSKVHIVPGRDDIILIDALQELEDISHGAQVKEVKSVKCYSPGGRKIDLFLSITEILSQKWYHCVQYTRRNLMSLISYC